MQGDNGGKLPFAVSLLAERLELYRISGDQSRSIEMRGNVSREKLDALASAALREWRVEDFERELVSRRDDTVYRVSTPCLERYALRIHRHNRFTNEELRSQLQWMQALNKCGHPTPLVVPAENGELFRIVSTADVPLGRQCDLQTWVDGIPLGSLAGNPATNLETIRNSYRMVGKLIARLHSHLTEWSPPAGFAGYAWDADSITGEDRTHGRLQELDFLTAGQSDLLQAAGEIVRHQVRNFGRDADRYGLIHANLFADNILTTGSGLQLIGFGQSGYGWHLFDIVTPAFTLLGTDNYEDTALSIIDGYRAVRQLPDEHLSMLPTFLMARALTSLASLSHPNISVLAPESGPALAKTVCWLAEDYCS